MWSKICTSRVKNCRARQKNYAYVCIRRSIYVIAFKNLVHRQINARNKTKIVSANLLCTYRKSACVGSEVKMADKTVRRYAPAARL